MAHHLPPVPSLWTRTRKGAVYHVSGLSFFVEERTGRKGLGGTFMVTPDPTSLKPWQQYELATGTSFTALNRRMTQLQTEALTWHRWDRSQFA